jgi:hypothetical protein
MRKQLLRALAPLFLPILASTAHGASITFDLSLDASPLIGGATSPYYFEFQLNDGDGVANTSVTLNNFAFGGGTAIGTPVVFGNALGDTATGITIDDGSFFNEFYQEFQPGNTLSFSVLFDSTLSDPVIPDRFTFAILNSSLFEIPTAGAGNELFGFDFRNPLHYELYAGVGGTNDPTLDAPTISSVPEPTSLWLLASGALGLLRFKRSS